MVLLGFNGRSYAISLPEIVTLESVQQAVSRLLSTAKEVGDGMEAVQPECLLHTLAETEAVSWRLRLIANARFRCRSSRRIATVTITVRSNLGPCRLMGTAGCATAQHRFWVVFQTRSRK